MTLQLHAAPIGALFTCPLFVWSIVTTSAWPSFACVCSLFTLFPVFHVRYLDPNETPIQFPFGFGLSYSNFSLALDSDDDMPLTTDPVVLFTNGTSPTLQVVVKVGLSLDLTHLNVILACAMATHHLLLVYRTGCEIC